METPSALATLLRVLALTALALATAAMIGAGAATSTACVIGITTGTFTSQKLARLAAAYPRMPAPMLRAM